MKKDRYREFFERSADAILIIEDNRFVDCNDAAVKMLRYGNKNELLNIHPSELSPQFQPDGRVSYEKADEMMKLAFKNGTHRFEWNHKRADGEVFPVEVSLTSVSDGVTASLHVVWREISDRKKIEESLRRLTSIVETTSDLVATVTRNGRIMYMNYSGRRMLGWNLDDDLDGKNIHDVHSRQSLEIVLQEGLPVAMEKGIWHGETTIIDKQGKDIPVSQVIMAHKNRQGLVEYLSTIMRDVSERKKSEQFLTNIINTVADPIFVKDHEHRFVVLNEAFCEFVGFPLDELLHKSDFDFFPTDQAKEFWKIDEQVLASGNENINNEVVSDIKGYTHIVSTKKTVFVDDEGKKFLVGVIRDITEQKKTEKNLHDNLHLLNSIIENLPICVKIIGRDGSLLDMNPSGLAMIGAPSKDAVVGRQLCDLIVENDKEAFLKFNKDVCEGKKSSLRFSMKALDGSLHVMDSFAVPLYYGPKDEIVQLGITRDITKRIAAEREKVKLESRLQQSQKMEAIGTLAGGIAHDFNNILSAILGYAELSLLSVPKDSNLYKDLSQIFKAGNRARELVRQILTFSRRSERVSKPVRLQLIMEETLKLLRATLPSTIDIHQTIDKSCHPIFADPSEMHQLLMNLCTNAYHAMRDSGGILTVSLQEITGNGEMQNGVAELSPGNHSKIEIRDTGIGMTKETASRIFEPYFTTKNPGEGTGLGLSVVHGVVKSNGGWITVESEPGMGTVFAVYFPCIADDEKIDEVLVPLDLPGGNEHILLVDDEPILVEMLGRTMEQLGYKVDSLTKSVEALALFSKKPDAFDLVITDMTMPELTGDRLAEELLLIRSDIPIILCTGFSEKIDEVQAKKIGIRRLVSKPISQKDLAYTIREVLSL